MLKNDARSTTRKKGNDYKKQLEELQKENAKLRAINEELAKSQITILEDAIQGAIDIVANNEETIKNGRKMAELTAGVEKSVEEVAKLALDVSDHAAIVEKSAKEIETHAASVASTSRTVGESALAVVNAAEQTNVNLQKLIEKRTNIIKELKAKMKQ
jgi:methyl-accepting chemotaxis protein